MPAIDYAVARSRMVKEQLIKRGITDERVLHAMGSVPRHLFVPTAFWPRAYSDHPLPIGIDQTISQPATVAIMCQELRFTDDRRILEIGTGSGYQAVVMAAMGHLVYTVERHEQLSRQAASIARQLGYTTISYRVADGSLGWLDEAPFDAIVVTAGAPRIPETLLDQLAPDGRLILPVGNRESQRMVVVEKRGNRIEQRDICPCTFVPLIGEEGWNGI